MPTVTFQTNNGTFTAQLYPTEAPTTVANFTKLVKHGFYDGIIYHRVIPNFVVQGGDPITKEASGLNNPRVGSGGPGWQIKCETEGNTHRHEFGSLSMAHAGKDTGGSQFFIVLSESNTRHLNGVHTVFGQVTKGLEVLPTIKPNDVMTRVRVEG